MKYVIMFTSVPVLDRQLSEETRQEDYAQIYQWFQDHGSAIADGGAELEPVETATTVKYGESGPVVADGPFSEAREVIGGFSVIDVADMDAAVALVKTWPSMRFPGTAIEIRPMVTDYSQFE
ncbi:hypothetical protein JOD63_001793 [Microbacterium terrae]|uniref:YCII-related domain protein n=1 Tax=Microbacterium terrae TaxID=69369 RepID=A0A0M2HGT1_9MICO|nr:YciI family protein [Microbacterium terrae]KJL43967.1 YCII-related domain protein [Microbacterium terrae]MBP1077825.1 hypothetical protein [Microbacterium terrae]GLJ99995.1 hypothetical protein GCM10017594_31930 [Microbacterium terrae]